MRTYAGAALALVAVMAAGCSSATPEPAPTVTATVTAAATDNPRARGIQLVQDASPGATTAQAEEMMRTACQLIGHNPTPAGVSAAASTLVDSGFGTRLEAMTVLTASIVGECPQHLGALEGL